MAYSTNFNSNLNGYDDYETMDRYRDAMIKKMRDMNYEERHVKAVYASEQKASNEPNKILLLCEDI